MTRSPHRPFGSNHPVVAAGALAVALVGLFFARGCTAPQPEPGEGQPFASPATAVDALITALRANDVERLRAIMGEGSRDILYSGDENADRIKREKFLALYDARHRIAVDDDDPDARTLVVGNADWPFPIPLVRRGSQWAFDVAAGRDEIINRRIGENELTTIQVCKAIADAQREYALARPDANAAREYARKIISDEGQRNGLYWPAPEGEPESPLGEFVAAASAEGYTRREHGPTPYHGYYYRILEAQGPNAPGGAADYVVNGKMTLGFAVVAYPADYGNSGIMTFMMGADGVVYQSALGEKTAETVEQMKAFDPGPGWTKVE
ncbi:MAG: DUF2950 domain-containing protein [Phycisphaerae bacterium]